MRIACISAQLLVALPILASNPQVPSPAESAGIRLTLVLDTSASMDDMLRNVRVVGVRLVESLGERDLARVMRFGGKVEFVHEFTSNHAKLASAISEIRRVSGTSSLYNALCSALKGAEEEADARPSPSL